MGSQKKKIIQEMFEVSAQFLDKGGGGYQKSLLWGIFWNYTLHLNTCSILKVQKIRIDTELVINCQ